MESYYWFDFETFGVNPVKDRPAQFAGVRTDLDFNVINEPLNILCKPANDFFPDPQACLVTGISPQEALEKGICERDFFRQIHLELSTPNTCAVGYNNIRFDDEVIRFGLYRNFFDAYAREWQNGNSRWDIIDLLRMTHALRPEGIHWPKDEQGKTSFRLEKLSIANNIEHSNAHDALADVYATIALAKLVKHQKPKLFNYLFAMRNKRRVAAEIDLVNHTPFVHCSGMLGNEHHYCAVMMPLVVHPTNKNSVICINLTKPIVDFNSLDARAIHSRIFSHQDQLPDGIERLAIKEVHYNKCPAIAPLGVLDEASRKRLNIDIDLCLKRAHKLKLQLASIGGKIIAAYEYKAFEAITNPDYALYSGGFFMPADKNAMDKIRQSNWDLLVKSQFQFNDKRLDEMLFRYRARNAPESLTKEEKQRWKDFRQTSLYDKTAGASLVYDELIEQLDKLQQDPSNNANLLKNVRDYADQITAEF